MSDGPMPADYFYETVAAARDRGSIPSSVERLQKAVSVLGDEVERLLERFSPVMTAAPAEGAFDTMPEAAATCSLEDDLMAVRRRVERIGSSLASAQVRCQL